MLQETLTQDTATDVEIRPFQFKGVGRGAGRPAPAHRCDALAQQAAGRRSVAGRAAGHAACARPLLGDQYDWRTCEARLNALPQFITEIDGVDIHFIHVRSRHENALPLIMTHGWPGSVIELLETVGPLTDPTSHGGSPEDAFHLVLPSLPGYGFSGEPTELGWGQPHGPRVGRADGAARLHALRRPGRRRGRPRHATRWAAWRPTGLLGIHVNLLAGALGIADRLPHGLRAGTRSAPASSRSFRNDGFGYFLEQSTRPQTIGYSLLDSPIGPGGLVARPRHGQLLQDPPARSSTESPRATSPATASSTTSLSNT